MHCNRNSRHKVDDVIVIDTLFTYLSSDFGNDDSSGDTGRDVFDNIFESTLSHLNFFSNLIHRHAYHTEIRDIDNKNVYHGSRHTYQIQKASTHFQNSDDYCLFQSFPLEMVAYVVILDTVPPTHQKFVYALLLWWLFHVDTCSCRFDICPYTDIWHIASWFTDWKA